MTIRAITYETRSTAQADGSSAWAADDQPFDGFHIQYRSLGGYVACEAIRLHDGLVVASASHSALTFADLRRFLASAY